MCDSYSTYFNLLSLNSFLTVGIPSVLDSTMSMIWQRIRGGNNKIKKDGCYFSFSSLSSFISYFVRWDGPRWEGYEDGTLLYKEFSAMIWGLEGKRFLCSSINKAGRSLCSCRMSGRFILYIFFI